jgi:hypothetical protein
VITEASEIGSEAVSKFAPLFIGIELIPMFASNGNKITPPLMPLPKAVTCTRLRPTVDCHEAKSLPEILFSIFLPFTVFALISTVILSPTKVKIGREPVKFALQELKLSELVDHTISLDRPIVKLVRTLAITG